MLSAYLFRFGFENPNEYHNNREHGWDDESSQALWVLAENEHDAELWGRNVAEEFVCWLFSQDGTEPYSWQNSGYFGAIENRIHALKASVGLTSIPAVICGEMPEFGKMMHPVT